jgi:hypothetical protein
MPDQICIRPRPQLGRHLQNDVAATLYDRQMTITRQPCDNRPVTIRHTCRKWGQQVGKYHRCSGICGTVFSLSVGLGPFVEAQPGSGKVGADVKILGPI